MVFPYLALEGHFMFFKWAPINSIVAPFVDNLLVTWCSKYLIYVQFQRCRCMKWCISPSIGITKHLYMWNTNFNFVSQIQKFLQHQTHDLMIQFTKILVLTASTKVCKQDRSQGDMIHVFCACVQILHPHILSFFWFIWLFYKQQPK